MQQCFINGQWSPGQGDELTATNPATGEVVWQGHSASSEDVDRAFQAAADAFGAWALRPLEERISIVKRYQALLEAHKETMARDIMLDTGKPLWECRTEAGSMIGKVALSITAYQERTGEKSSGDASMRTRLEHRPHGVCAVFGPYNFPGHLPNGHIIPALIAGNTLVFKPSEQTPRSGERMVALLAEAGVPAGVINFLPGELDTAKAITAHPLLRGFFFTGSSQVGKLIHEQFAGQPEKILALEMGGNNPLVVLDDAPTDAAVYHTIQSAFITAGQRCTCARRLIVPHGEAGDRFIAALVEASKALHIAAPDADPAPFYATVINNTTANHLLNAQEDLIALGGKALLTMQRLEEDKPYLSPAIIDLTEAKDVPDEEHFGPLLKVYRVSDLDAAIALANATQYGLSAGIFTEDDEAWQRFYTLSQAGIVNRNKPITGASGNAPFGGTGCSGNHRPGAYYAADYCAYPVASVSSDHLHIPSEQPPGMSNSR
ncbi:succinylglutamate-semialdehyde dehydrogenase [Suttonella sp. R2A3]|uniref:succinylglutamate-semialdehyde dehydrogenase n=1 Tax=Suttonella sp. R2A3 TaxID=2908648 RepID=UPI001F257E9B|nr:succinylglutamate-semialdehyde dehydrogenase [Suttonella sp. R2A3]UJF24253.1 succinylglutamate-semialdehyde dehydrogenase [Suttonella sp. R2A3]